MDYIPRGIDIELWSKVKAKATPERKTIILSHRRGQTTLWCP
jgi:hypothetical protein